MIYKAFISYSHAADGKLAPALQFGLHRFARPWYRLRAIRVFRDDTNLSVSPGLWSSIEQALGQSDYFLLLASPQAAASKWVRQEVDFWLRHRSPQTLLIILTDGDLVWNSRGSDVDWNATTALPSNLAKVFAEEPLFLDLRWAKTSTDLSLNNPLFRDKIADLASTLHGRPKDELIGEDVRQHRKVKRLTWSAVSALVLLTIAAIAGAVVAVTQRNVAQARRLISIAQGLTAQAPQQQRALKQDERAALLARQAYLFNEQNHGHIHAQIADTLRAVLTVPFFSQILRAHHDRVWAVAFSADGQTLASGSLDGTVRLWTLRRLGDEPRILRGHTLGVTSVAFSPRGNRVASTGEDGTVRLWSLEPPFDSTVLKAESGRLWGVAFSPDGERLAAGGDDTTVRLWDLQQPREPAILSGHAGSITSVAFSPNGLTLASASYDSTVGLWDVRRPGDTPRFLRGHTSPVRAVAFHPDGQVVASAAEDGTMRVWNLLEPTSEATEVRHSAMPRALAFSPDGRQLASASDDGIVRLWVSGDLNAMPALLRGHDDRIWAIAISRDGRLATASDDMSVRLYDLEPGPVAPKVFRERQGQVKAVAFGSDGRTLASGGDDKTVRVRNLDESKAPPAVLKGHEFTVVSLALSGDGRTLASADLNGVVRLWNLQQAGAAPFVLGTPGGVTVAFSPDRKTLASGGNKTVRLRDLHDLTAAPTILGGHENWVSSVVFSHDSQFLASASLDNTIRLWNLRQPGVDPAVLRGHEDKVWAVAFSPDDRWLASGSDDRTVRIWNPRQPSSPAVTLRGHEDKVRTVAASPDGHTFASGGTDSTIRLWDSRQPAEEPAVLEGHTSEVTSLSFSPDGQRLASGSGDGTVRVWFVNSQALADTVCERVRRNLTVDEWNKFVGDDIPYQRTCPTLPSGEMKVGKVTVAGASGAPTMLFPADHAVFHHFPRTLTLRWAPTPGVVSYTVEVQFSNATWALVPNILATSYTLEFVGAQPGKWRVWSVGLDGQESAKSTWRLFEFTR